MHATEPNTNLRHQKRIASFIFYMLVDVILQHSVLLLSQFQIEIWIFQLVHELIADYTRILWEFLLSHLWLFRKVSIQSNEHVKIPRGTRICRDISATFGRDWLMWHDGGQLDIFEEFFEKLDEKRVDLILIWIDYVENLQERVLYISDILHRQ